MTTSGNNEIRVYLRFMAIFAFGIIFLRWYLSVIAMRQIGSKAVREAENEDKKTGEEREIVRAGRVGRKKKRQKRKRKVSAMVSFKRVSNNQY